MQNSSTQALLKKDHLKIMEAKVTKSIGAIFDIGGKFDRPLPSSGARMVMTIKSEKDVT